MRIGYYRGIQYYAIGFCPLYVKAHFDVMSEVQYLGFEYNTRIPYFLFKKIQDAFERRLK